MTYNTPELLLVGAAQTLVQTASFAITGVKANGPSDGCDLREDDPTNSDDYQPDGSW